MRIMQLPVDMQIELFNKLVKPILLYGCEIWGFGNIDVIECVQLKFIKYILKLKNSTPNYMVYGEHESPTLGASCNMGVSRLG